MAQAVQNVFPGTRLGIGPPTADGFFYDFLTEHNFTPEDLVTLETEMRRIVDGGQLFRRRVASSLAEAEGAVLTEPLKQELIATHPVPWRFGGDEYGEDALSFYDNLSYAGDLAWSDLCRGPHVLDTKYLGVYPHPRGGCLLARGREASAVAAHLRDLVPRPEGSQGIPDRARGTPQARSPQARRGTGPLCVRPQHWEGPAPVAAQRDHHPRRVGALGAGVRASPRLQAGRHAPPRQGRPLLPVRPLAVLRRGHVRPDLDRRRDVLPAADELPASPHGLSGTAQVVPRPSVQAW